MSNDMYPPATPPASQWGIPQPTADAIADDSDVIVPPMYGGPATPDAGTAQVPQVQLPPSFPPVHATENTPQEMPAPTFATEPIAEPVPAPVATPEPEPEPAPAAPVESQPTVPPQPAVPAPVTFASAPVDPQAPEPAPAADDGQYRALAEETSRTANATAETLTAIQESLDKLSQQFAKRLQYDDEKETIIDRQHRELTQLREGLKTDLIQPVLYDVAETLDAVHKMRVELEQDAKQTDHLLEHVEFMLLDILEKNDVEQVESEPGEPFNAARQRMVKTEETTDASKRKIIVRSLAPGYMFGKTALFKEKVVVYKVVAEPPKEETPSAEPDAR